MKKFYYIDTNVSEILDEKDRERFDELQEKGRVGLTDDEYEELTNLCRYCEETILRRTQKCTELAS